MHSIPQDSFFQSTLSLHVDHQKEQAIKSKSRLILLFSSCHPLIIHFEWLTDIDIARIASGFKICAYRNLGRRPEVIGIPSIQKHIKILPCESNDRTIAKILRVIEIGRASC